jgi:hypothetical protein
MPTERMLRTIWLGGLFKSEMPATLTTGTGGACKFRRNAGLPGPGRARHQHTAAAEEPFTFHHLVQSGDSRGNEVGESFMGQCQRGDRQHRDTVFIDEERVFIGAVGSAPVF